MFRKRDLQDPQAERLLAGDAADLPPAYQRVAGLLSAARATQAPGTSREKATVAAMLGALHSPQDVREMTSPRTKTPRRAVRRIKVAAVAVTGAMALMTSLAFAGHLPGAAQDFVHDMLGDLGVPAGDNAADAADSRGERADDVRQDGNGGGGVTTQDGEDGSQISEDAKEIPTDGDFLENSGDLAEEASDGQSTTGTDTAEESADGTPPAGPETGENTAEEGSGNGDDFRP